MLLSWPVLRLSCCWTVGLGAVLSPWWPQPVCGRSPAAMLVPPMLAEAPPDEVSTLVRQLGARDYASRERAQARLRRMGLEVFDQLYEAQSSDDIEIALRARYLLHRLTIRWIQDDDPTAVKELLRAYDEKSETERKIAIEQLVRLPENQGIGAVCRIVRFETSNVLSKQAALMLMRRQVETSDSAESDIVAVITAALGASQREASDWLRLYVSTLRDPTAALSEWETISNNQEQIFRNTSDPSAADIVRDLLRWQADLLQQVGRHEESIAVVLKSIELLDGTQQQLLDSVDWLIQRRAWATVLEIAKRFSERFQASTLLLYRLAEAQLRSGRGDEAEKTAELALGSNLESNHEHLLAAYSLQERGLLSWSEREYRYVLQQVLPASQEGLQARLLFSEMLHDQQREQQAAEVLREIVDAMEKDQNIRYLVARFRREPGSLASRMYFFLAEHARLNGDQEKKVEKLKKAIQFDPTDADVLIGMYRASEGDSDWHNEVLRLIVEATKTFRDEIDEYERQEAESPTEEIRTLYRRELASANNQLAWLVSNTEGDYDEALRRSHRSLELRPETAAYLDTLGRCYYARGDYANAILYQSRAVELEPHSGQIRRQLEFFRKALETAQAQLPQ